MYFLICIKVNISKKIFNSYLKHRFLKHFYTYQKQKPQKKKKKKKKVLYIYPENILCPAVNQKCQSVYICEVFYSFFVKCSSVFN